MIKYKVNIGSYPDGKITPVEVDRETEHFVLITRNGRQYRDAKASSYDAYFDTWEAAHEALMARAKSSVENANNTLQRAVSFADLVSKLTPPIAALEVKPA